MSSGNNNGQVIHPVPAQGPEPDWDVIREREPAVLNTVPVRVEGYVDAREVPSKRGVWFTHNVPSIGNEPVEIIPGDPRIKAAWFLISTGNAGSVWIGTKEQVKNVPTPQGFLANAGWFLGPFFGHEVETYAIAVTPGVNTIAVRLEYWGD